MHGVGVADIRERVSVENHQVSELPDLDAAEVAFETESFGTHECCHAEGIVV